MLSLLALLVAPVLVHAEEIPVTGFRIEGATQCLYAQTYPTIHSASRFGVVLGNGGFIDFTSRTNRAWADTDGNVWVQGGDRMIVSAGRIDLEGVNCGDDHNRRTAFIVIPSSATRIHLEREDASLCSPRLHHFRTVWRRQVNYTLQFADNVQTVTHSVRVPVTYENLSDCINMRE